MKSRILHHPDIPVSEIGLGCWQLGGADWGFVDDERAFSILRQAIDSGITFFDTADVYGSGRSEELIGQFLRENGLLNKVFVATKLGRMGDLYPDKYTEEGVRQATENSLRRLGVESLDLTQLHCVPTEILSHGEIFEWLRKLRSEGKIHRFGASVESDEEGLLCLQQEGLASLADELKSFVPEGVSMASMAQRWILDHEAVTTVITGASSMEQVIQNASVSDLPPLQYELTATIRKFYEHSVAGQIRGPY